MKKNKIKKYLNSYHMEHKEFRTKLISHIENLLAKKVVATSTPPQGMTSQVFFIKLDNDAEYAVKYGEDAMNDVPALRLITEKKIDIPVPINSSKLLYLKRFQ